MPTKPQTKGVGCYPVAVKWNFFWWVRKRQIKNYYESLKGLKDLYILHTHTQLYLRRF